MAKILIVDDERDVLFVVKHLLNENGYKTFEATNGLAALELFQNEFVDLVITDQRMPLVDGLSFLREVKKLEPATPVIILTAYASAETAIESMDNGAFSYMTKPFKADELLNTVKLAINTRLASNLLAGAPPAGSSPVKRAFLYSNK